MEDEPIDSKPSDTLLTCGLLDSGKVSDPKDWDRSYLEKFRRDTDWKFIDIYLLTQGERPLNIRHEQELPYWHDGDDHYKARFDNHEFFDLYAEALETGDLPLQEESCRGHSHSLRDKLCYLTVDRKSFLKWARKVKLPLGKDFEDMLSLPPPPKKKTLLQQRCKEWLDIKLSDPTLKGSKKAVFRAGAKKEFGEELGKNEFDRAWAEATTKHPKCNKPGPKPQARTPKQFDPLG